MFLFLLFLIFATVRFSCVSYFPVKGQENRTSKKKGKLAKIRKINNAPVSYIPMFFAVLFPILASVGFFFCSFPLKIGRIRTHRK